MFSTNTEKETLFSRGFPVGFHTDETNKKKQQHYLYNHIRIIIQYHDDKGSENPGGEATTTKVYFYICTMFVCVKYVYMYMFVCMCI
jgi:hypothetical protein